ncbi:MBL fold metallo-hydrolase [Desulforhopalus sp. IMCC35007]|uniref:MBL fold metallo-hydrolase n=1 Tax=Desulforhopalus sp. IMCC35007 TaxID=2569543 RepID=UPI0010AE5C94|nr:MBL fold metallo-hydrolase [Desulforhopalus sp. IMCC35007]TKB08185.1 MBL fold metallo-hydrolase [Desulforhopalus sp. IMCC35007]
MIYAKQHDFGPVKGFEVGIAPLGTPIKSVYLYQIGSILIDTGPHHLRTKVSAMLGGTRITSILLTHHHEDHSGNAALLKKQFSTSAYLHPYGISKLYKGFNILPYQHILFGKAPLFLAEIFPAAIENENLTLTALHTPGHSKDHTVFHAKKEGWLFSGDLYVGEKIQFFRIDEDITQQIESLRKIAALDFDKLFCSHRPCMEDGRTRIQRKLDYLIRFNQQVLELHNKGMDEKEIICRLRIKNDLPVKLFTMGNACFAHMIRSSLNSLQSITK